MPLEDFSFSAVVITTENSKQDLSRSAYITFARTNYSVTGESISECYLESHTINALNFSDLDEFQSVISATVPQ